MEVIVKSSPKIEIELATKVVKVGGGGNVTVDSALSTTSENPVMNKVVTEELGKKVNKEDVATINGKSLTEGGNVVIEGGTSATPDWNANLGEKGHIQNRPFRIIDTASGDEHKFDTPLKESDFTLIVQENEYGDIESARWEKIIAYSSVGIMGVFANGYYEPTFGTSYKGAIRPLGQLYRQSYYYEESDDRKYIIYIENIINDHGDYYEEYSKLIVENDSGFGTDFPNADVYVLTSEDYPVRIDAIDENYLPDTIARTNDVEELREETTALWENLDHGTFPDLTAGDLAGRGESVPAEFGFRASGGKSIKDGRAYIKRIKGNSVVWNQKASFNILVDSLGIAESTDIEGGKMITLTQDYTGSNDYDIRMAYNGQLIAGHVYCVSMETYSSKGGRVNMDYGGSIVNRGDISANTWSLVATIGVAASDKANFNIYPNFKSVGYLAGDTFGVRNVRVTDLTKMFQADNEPTTIEEFYARVATLGIEDMNAYNDGEVIHMNTESIKSVGDNAWDEEWENGTFSIVTGENINGDFVDSQIRTKNLIRVLPNETYCLTISQASIWAVFYDAEGNLIEKPVGDVVADNAIFIKGVKQFRTPTNAAYIKFYTTVDYGTTYKHDIMITLVHSGWKQDTDAGYQPYWQDTLPLPIIRKYFPDGMKKAGTAHDEIRFNKASGKWEYSKGRMKEVDMGTLNWSKGNSGAGGAFSASLNNASNTTTRNVITIGKYEPHGSAYTNSDPTRDAICISAKRVYVSDTQISDVATFKAAMAGVILYYESNDWEWEELDAEDQNFRDYYNVADFGTEEAIPATDAEGNIIPSAAFSADIIYQFNAVDMIREHELEITELQSIIATMQAQLTSLTNGGQ